MEIDMSELIIKDGIRAIANTALSPELALKTGQAFAFTLSREDSAPVRILVGKDTRASSDMLEAAFSAGVCSFGAGVVCVGIIPTPALGILVQKYKMDAAVMIGGAEAPFEYNGISFFGSDGAKISEAALADIIARATGEKILPSAAAAPLVGRIRRTHTALRDYVDYVKSTAASRLSGIKLAIDSANGCAFECAKLVFTELGADVEMINNRPDGVNINAECGISNLRPLSQFVISHKCTLGISFSGDADDFALVDKLGKRVETCCIGDALTCALDACCKIAE